MFDGDYDYDSLPVIFIWIYKVLWDINLKQLDTIAMNDGHVEAEC